MTTRQFKPVKKDRLFYGQFEYCIGFHLDEVNCLRVLDHDHIDEFITRRKQWREIAQQRWVNGRQKHGIIMSRSWRDITEKTVADLHVLADILLATQYEFKLVVSVNQGHVYTNDQDLIDQLDLMPAATFKTYTQAQISRPKNSIQLKNSQHAFRSYFKLLKLTAEQKDQLVNFLLNQQDHVRLSPSLLSWMRQPFNRTQDYFFVDHDTQAWLTMLSLIQSGIIRKTMPITTDK